MALSPKERLEREESFRREFNRLAREGLDRYDEIRRRKLVETAVADIPLQEDERILDVGCGDGWLCRLLSPRCPQGAVVGIDISDEMIDLARRHSLDFENILHAPGSAEEIPWAEDYFTCVFSVEGAYYWSAPERAAAEMFRVMAWGGRFCALISFYEDNPAVHHWQNRFSQPLRLMKAAEWQELFELLGFREVEARHVPAAEALREELPGGELWRSQQEWEEFNRIGALLLSGKKPDLPPPGPLTSEPDPLQIAR